jgi:hypothetical protein
MCPRNPKRAFDENGCATQGTEQKLWGVYWNVESGFTSTLEMKNNRLREYITANISLYFTNGAEVPLEPVNLAPRQTVTLNLNDIIEALPLSTVARTFREGTVEVEFIGPNSASLMGSVSVINPEKKAAWNFFLYPERPSLGAAPVRGVFWLPNSRTDGFVAVQNISPRPLTVSPVIQMAGKRVSAPVFAIPPEQGVKFRIRDALTQIGLPNATEGGIEFTHDGNGDALRAHGVLFDGQGFSAEIDFLRFDSWPQEEAFNYRTPRMAIGSPDPALGLPAGTAFQPSLVLHNFNTHTLDVKLSLGVMSGTTSNEFSKYVTLQPGETRVLKPHQAVLARISSDLHWANLEVSYRDWHNGLSMMLVSTSQGERNSIRSVLNWVEAITREGWYWRADQQFNTLLGIFNSDFEDALVSISLDFYENGVRRSYELPQRTIPKRSSELLNIREIILAGVPDADGDVIPPTIGFGGYRVKKLGPSTLGNLTTEALIFQQFTAGFLSVYNTGCCDETATLFPSSLTGLVGQDSQLEVYTIDTCGGESDLTSLAKYSVSPPPPGTPTIASVSTGGLVSLEYPGKTTVSMSVTHLKVWKETNCRTQTDTGSCAVTVKPNVTISGPADVPLRASGSTGPNSITLTAEVSPENGTFLWTTTSSKVTLSNTSSQSVTVTAQTESSAVGDVPVKIKYTVNEQFTEVIKNISVRKPTALAIISDATNPSGTSCSGSNVVKCLANPGSGTCVPSTVDCPYTSFLRAREYSTLDQFGARFVNLGISSLDVQESYVTTSATCSANFVTGPATTADFIDHFWFCHTCCLPGGPGCTISRTQTITVNGFIVRQVAVTYSCSGATLTP